MPALSSDDQTTDRAAVPGITDFEMKLLAGRRSRWRQRLVDAEQGFRFGLRCESTLYATAFAVLLIGAAAVIMRVSAVEAGLLIVALTQSVACTFMRLIVKEVLGFDTTAHRLAAAAAVASALGGLIVAGLVLVPKAGW